MEGRIQNRTLLQLVADILDLEGVRRFPSTLDTGDVKAVFEIGQYANGGGGPAPTATPNAGMGESLWMDSTAYDIAGLIDGTVDIIGDSVSHGYPLPTALNYAYRFDALEIHFDTNTAGATAMAGKPLVLYLIIIGPGDPGAMVHLISLQPWDILEASGLHAGARWTMHEHSRSLINSTGFAYGASSWDGGFVCGATTINFGGGTDGPLKLYCQIRMEDGTAFPAVATLQVRALVRRSTNGIVPIKL